MALKTINRIIFLTGIPFNRRDFKRFAIELLERNGFKAEVWDLTAILNPNLQDICPPEIKSWPGYRIFVERKGMVSDLKSLSSDTFVITLFQYSLGYYPIYKAISESSAEYTSFIANTHTMTGERLKAGGSFDDFENLGKSVLKRLMNYTFKTCPFTRRGIKPARLILAGGSASVKYAGSVYRVPMGYSTEILWLHALDYDLYLEERDRPFFEKETAVFLDQYVPFHPHYRSDYAKKMGLAPPISGEKYYSLLNKFFKRVEDKLHLEVVIAAHPRSDYENHPEYFERRKCIKGKTVRLVRESKLVLAHNSTALSFANLFRKPVIFLTVSEFSRKNEDLKVEKIADYFGTRPVFIDSNTRPDLSREIRISGPHYDEYRRAYIKTDGSPDLPFWQITADRLKKGL